MILAYSIPPEYEYSLRMESTLRVIRNRLKPVSN